MSASHYWQPGDVVAFRWMVNGSVLMVDGGWTAQ